MADDGRSRFDRVGLGANIRAARKLAGLTQEQLGEKLGISNVAIGQFEHGRSMPAVTTLAELAQALGVTYGVLLGEPFAKAEALAALVRAEVRELGYDVALIPRTAP